MGVSNKLPRDAHTVGAGTILCAARQPENPFDNFETEVDRTEGPSCVKGKVQREQLFGRGHSKYFSV